MRVFLARGAIQMFTGLRIGFVILSNRLGRDLTPFYLFVTVGQSQYSLYSNELSITEPFYESSEEPN